MSLSKCNIVQESNKVSREESSVRIGNPRRPSKELISSVVGGANRNKKKLVAIGVREGKEKTLKLMA